MAAVPSIGRAARLDEPLAPEADVTRSLYEQYANQIFRYCLHQLGSREEAEDAVQSTFLNAFRGIKRGVVPEVESAWLFKIAHNVCLSRHRSAWRRGRIESPTDFDVVEELAPAPSRRADELIGLQDVLEQMPETQRRAILLREWQGLSYREIGEELELSQAAVETLIFRARRSLASGLEQPFERRRARALDWGSLVAGLKSAFLGGSVAAKVAATVAVVGATTVVAAAPVIARHEHRTAPNKAPAQLRRVPVSTAIVAPAVRLVHSAPAKPAAPAAGRPAHHRTAVRSHPATRVRHARRSARAPSVPASHHQEPAAAAERPTTLPAAAHATAHGRANGTGAGQQPAPAVQGNGHAYGHAKHVQAAPAVGPQPVRAPDATDPVSQAPGDAASAGQSDVPHGNALGRDKSGGAAAASVDTPGSGGR